MQRKNSPAHATPCSRRSFLRLSFGAAAGTSAFGLLAQTHTPLRAAVVGHTGQGDYGHGHDMVFTGREDIRLVAVADADPTGLQKALQRTGAPKGYADYHEMLEREKPDLVSVAPRWTTEHHAMALAALRQGAHLWMEKPITQTLAQADELLEVAQRSGRKIAVAHQMRLAPPILQLHSALVAGDFGELLTLRAHGKQDRRAGGEDLVVLGVHLFDLMRFLAGDARWCAASVRQEGHEITLADARSASEDIGPIAGDNISAQLAFDHGVEGTFTSRAEAREALGPWGIQVTGTKGTARILADINPRLFTLASADWSNDGRQERWRPFSPMNPAVATTDAANSRLLEDLLAAIREDREPQSSGYSAMKALEMAAAVFSAGLARTRVTLPLSNRNHPLS